MQDRLDREQPGEQRYKDHADYGYTSAGHEPVSYTHLDVYKRQITLLSLVESSAGAAGACSDPCAKAGLSLIHI